MSQCDGPAQLLGVDLVGRDGELAGVVEEVVQQDLGGQHRQKRQDGSEAPAAENMFPKLLDVPMRTYFIVLAKIRRPSATPPASTSRLFSSRITSAESLATSVAVSTEIPTSAACSARASLTPSPRNATPRACDAAVGRSGLFVPGLPGRTRSYYPSPRPARRQYSASICAPLSTPCTLKPSCTQTARATSALSPVTTLTAIPRPASRLRASAASTLGGSE